MIRQPHKCQTPRVRGRFSSGLVSLHKVSSLTDLGFQLFYSTDYSGENLHSTLHMKLHIFSTVWVSSSFSTVFQWMTLLSWAAPYWYLWSRNLHMRIWDALSGDPLMSWSSIKQRPLSSDSGWVWVHWVSRPSSVHGVFASLLSAILTRFNSQSDPGSFTLFFSKWLFPSKLFLEANQTGSSGVRFYWLFLEQVLHPWAFLVTVSRFPSHLKTLGTLIP